MAELLVKLPDTLYNQLDLLAHGEGVSINQYVLYSLTQQVTNGYRVERVPAAEVQKQAEDIAELRARWREIGSDKEIDQLLAEREIVEPEPELTPELVSKLKARIAAAKNAQSVGKNTVAA